MNQADSKSITAGQMFVYDGTGEFDAGAGQVLGSDGEVVFVRLFDDNGDELRTLMAFMPVLRKAYLDSHPRVIRQLDLPIGHDELLSEWYALHKTGEAGVFTGTLGEVKNNVLETVGHFRDVPVGMEATVELAYPTRSPSGDYDRIKAFVRTSPKD